jgi:hypothetical protein
MEAATAPRQAQWTFAQWAVVIVISLQLLWALAGLIAEPSIDFGEGAVTEKVLGVDFNGVHALSGFLLFLPGYYFATRPKWAVYYSIFTFPNNHADAYFHMATGTLFALIAVIQLTRDKGRLGD